MPEIAPTLCHLKFDLLWADRALMALTLKGQPTRQEFVEFVEPWFETYFLAAQRPGFLVVDVRRLDRSPDPAFVLEAVRWSLAHLFEINRLSYGQVYITQDGLIHSMVNAVLAKIPLQATFGLRDSVESALQQACESIQSHGAVCDQGAVRLAFSAG